MMHSVPVRLARLACGWPGQQCQRPVRPKELDAYRCAANYLSTGQSYLYDNPLLKRPQTLTDHFAKSELAILAKNRRPCW
jgi:hypothetical protein